MPTKKKKQTNKQKTRKGDQTLYAHSKFTFSSWQTSNILVILSGSQLTESTNPRNTKLGLTRQRWWIIPLPMPFLTILGKTVNETSYWRRLYAVWNNTQNLLTKKEYMEQLCKATIKFFFFKIINKSKRVH